MGPLLASDWSEFADGVLLGLGAGCGFVEVACAGAESRSSVRTKTRSAARVVLRATAERTLFAASIACVLLSPTLSVTTLRQVRWPPRTSTRSRPTQGCSTSDR